uniref:Uncharacterized protein n=3 Tax=Hemiselmis andersenii TaxID=464988 RepID=A0A6T8GDL3_HEMAN|mmetsp:Transcript_10406/g.24274  ORF Transcript_10406/g.24274 Transcript_10406/m.24274 type:complete len:606 (+) Transcript_10406:224-2041(+)
MRNSSGPRGPRGNRSEEDAQQGEGLLPKIGAHRVREGAARGENASPSIEEAGYKGGSRSGGSRGLVIDVEREPEGRGSIERRTKSTTYKANGTASTEKKASGEFEPWGTSRRASVSSVRSPDRSPESVMRKRRPFKEPMSWQEGEDPEEEEARKAHEFTPPAKIHIFVREVPALPPEVQNVPWLAEAAAKAKREEGGGRHAKGKGKGKNPNSSSTEFDRSTSLHSRSASPDSRSASPVLGRRPPSVESGRSKTGSPYPGAEPHSFSDILSPTANFDATKAALEGGAGSPYPLLPALMRQQPARRVPPYPVAAAGPVARSRSGSMDGAANEASDGEWSEGEGCDDATSMQGRGSVTESTAPVKLPSTVNDFPTALDRLRNREAPLKEVLLRGCKLGDEGVKELSGAMTDYKCLKKLDLAWNAITAAGCRVLCKSIVTTKNLTCIILNKNNIGDKGAVALAFVLKPEPMKPEPKISKVELIGNQIGPAGATAIAEALMKNKVIKRLHMGGNEVGDKGAKPMSELVMKNVSLKQVFLDHNGITDKGAKMLAHAMKVNSKIDQLDLFNNDKIGDKGAKAIDEAMNNPIWFVRLPKQQTTSGVIASLSKE